jgi:hypothetical protein
MAENATMNRADELVRLGDDELVELIYDTVTGVLHRPARDLDDFLDEMYFVLTEAFERFAPAAELAALRQRSSDSVESMIEGMARRHAARLTARAERSDDV